MGTERERPESGASQETMEGNRIILSALLIHMVITQTTVPPAYPRSRFHSITRSITTAATVITKT